MRRCLAATGALLAVAAGALLAGVVIRREPSRHRSAGTNPLLLLRTNALHTDLGIPATPLVRRRFGFLKDVGIPVDHPLMTHILVGWGGEGFYPNNGKPYRIGPLTLLHSMVGDDSVLRFAALSHPGGSWSGCEEHRVSDAALEALIGFVERTLEREENGEPRSLDHEGITELDHFFEARPTFAALAGCNVWVSEALAEAGIASGRWTPLPQLLTNSIRFHRRQGARSERPNSIGPKTLRGFRKA